MEFKNLLDDINRIFDSKIKKDENIKNSALYKHFLSMNNEND